jgi:hypothetical protein
MTGELTFFELGVDDVGLGRAFYEGLFGWRFQPGPSGQGFTIATPNVPRSTRASAARRSSGRHAALGGVFAGFVESLVEPADRVSREERGQAHGDELHGLAERHPQRSQVAVLVCLNGAYVAADAPEVVREVKDGAVREAAHRRLDAVLLLS